jgi:hypothetical protein
VSLFFRRTWISPPPAGLDLSRNKPYAVQPWRCSLAFVSAMFAFGTAEESFPPTPPTFTCKICPGVTDTADAPDPPSPPNLNGAKLPPWSPKAYPARPAIGAGYTVNSASDP